MTKRKTYLMLAVIVSIISLMSIAAQAQMTDSTPTGTNFALQAVTVQTDTNYSSSYDGTKAKDGVISAASKWCSTNASSTHWISYDLGTTRRVNGFIVRHAGAAGELTSYNLKNFKFQSASSLSGPWTDEAVVDNTAQANVTTRSYASPKLLRYVRLYITNPGIDNYARLPEFEIWCADDMNTNTPSGTNMALSATTVQTDSNYSSSYDGTKAKDGVVSQASKWCSTATVATHWLSYDLGANRTVNGFIVRHAGAAGESTLSNLKIFKIQSAASLSGPWVDECSVDNTAQANVTTRAFYTAKTLRYIRLYITNPGADNYARVPEFEVWCAASTGAISGTVKNTSNVAISGATVSTTTGGYTTTTNSSGAYTLANVAPGTYSVVASKSGYVTNTQTGKSVTAGATTTVNFTLTASASTGTISGYVRDGRYVAISGATVSTTSGGYSTTTNSSGAYTLSNVATGTYNVVAVKTGQQTTTIQSETVTSGATTTVNFQMPYSHSKFGWHIVQGARNGFGTFLATTNGCGKPVAVIKGVDDLAPCAEAKSYNPKTITVGRFCFINGTDYNNLAGLGWVSQYTPQQAADMAWPIHKAAFDPHKSYVDIWEIVNEWDSDYQWQADYMIAMMNKAEADGYRLGLFASSGGTPSETVYSHIARACARAKQSGGHVLTLHEYGFFGDGLLQSQSTSLVTRYRQLYNYLVANNSECPILLTEVGQGGGYDFVGDALFLQDHAWYDGQVRQDSYVLGTCAWTLGNWLNAQAQTALDEMQTYICNN